MLPAYIRIHDKIKADVDDGTWKSGNVSLASGIFARLLM